MANHWYAPEVRGTTKKIVARRVPWLLLAVIVGYVAASLSSRLFRAAATASEAHPVQASAPSTCTSPREQTWRHRIGTPAVIYDASRASGVIAADCPIEVMDSGLAQGRGIIAVPPVGAKGDAEYVDYRLIVADAWEGLYSYSLEHQGPARKLPNIEVCPERHCADVDHRGLLFDPSDPSRFLLAETHQQRIAMRYVADGALDPQAPDIPLLEGITDMTVLANRQLVVALAPPTRPVSEAKASEGGDAQKDQPQPRGRVGLLPIGEPFAAFEGGEFERPVGVAYAPCADRIYVADVGSEQMTWYYFQRHGEAWRRGGVLASERLDRAPTPPVMQGMAVTPCTRGGGVFAAGPGGLYVFHHDGTLLARYLLSERITALTWGRGTDAGSLYMTIGHRIARLRTRVADPPSP